MHHNRTRPPKAQEVGSATALPTLNAQAKGLANVGRKAGVIPWREARPRAGPPKEQAPHRRRESLR